mgnify:CR=1 FL=1
MVDYVKFLPEEIQRKIFYMSLEHPTAKIMKPLINEINEETFVCIVILRIYQIFF